MDECSLYIYEVFKNYVYYLIVNEIRFGLYFYKLYIC